MNGIFEIDLVRASLETELNDSKILFASFYEQMKDVEEISRYETNIDKILGEMDNSDKKAVGIIYESGESQITNLRSVYARPFSWILPLHFHLKDRDEICSKMDSVIESMKGTKMDCVILSDGKIIPTKPLDKNSYVQSGSIISDSYLGSEEINDKLDSFEHNFDIYYDFKDNDCVYCLDKTQKKIWGYDYQSSRESEGSNQIFVFNITEKNWTNEHFEFDFKLLDSLIKHISIDNFGGDSTDCAESIAINFGTSIGYIATSIGNQIILTSVDKKLEENDILAVNQINISVSSPIVTKGSYPSSAWKVMDNINGLDYKSLAKCDLSFTGMALKQPYTNNGEDECVLTLRGEATVCSDSVSLGNDVATLKFSYIDGALTTSDYLEPLDSPTSFSMEGISYQLRQNGMKKNVDHVSLSSDKTFTFVVDYSSKLINYWRDLSNGGSSNITPETKYSINEIRCSFGKVTSKVTGPWKISSNINVSNSDSDIEQISVSMSLQGENE